MALAWLLARSPVVVPIPGTASVAHLEENVAGGTSSSRTKSSPPLAEPLRLGLLSTARINRRILAPARESEVVEVTAVASRDRSRAESYAREHGIGRSHGSYEELLADPDLDAVYIALPNALHVEWSQRAIEAGKHVLCEKPLGDGPEEVEALFDLAEEKRLVLAEGFMYRHNLQTRRLDGLVTEGAIGRLQLVRASFTFLLEREPDVRLDPGLGGGSVLDLGAYCVSGARLLAGEPETVVGQQVLGPTGVDELFTGSLVFQDGCSASSTAGCERPFVPSSKPSAPKVHSLWTTPGSAATRASSFAQTAAPSESQSRRRTRTCSSWRISPAPWPGRPSRSWAGRTQWARRGLSPPCAARRPNALRSGSELRGVRDTKVGALHAVERGAGRSTSAGLGRPRCTSSSRCRRRSSRSA